uniref:Uncharacterized protein n=1 Tax=Arundo donax TaxID=35708 RepID=A0A0A9FET0_ARUDO
MKNSANSHIHVHSAIYISTSLLI